MYGHVYGHVGTLVIYWPYMSSGVRPGRSAGREHSLDINGPYVTNIWPYMTMCCHIYDHKFTKLAWGWCRHCQGGLERGRADDFGLPVGKNKGSMTPFMGRWIVLNCIRIMFVMHRIRVHIVLHRILQCK